jgi:hypothetical protein
MQRSLALHHRNHTNTYNLRWGERCQRTLHHRNQTNTYHLRWGERCQRTLHHRNHINTYHLPWGEPYAAFFDKVLLIVDGRYWCGFCDAVFFDNVLLIVDGRYWCGFCDLPSTMRRTLSKNAASQKPHQNPPSTTRRGQNYADICILSTNQSINQLRIFVTIGVVSVMKRSLIMFTSL